MYSGSRIDVTSRPRVGIVHNKQMPNTARRSGRLRSSGGRHAATRPTDVARAASLAWAGAVTLAPADVGSCEG